MDRIWIVYFVAVALFLAATTPAATTASGQASPPSALPQLPVREVTVFKDGHAFVLHEGTMPVDASGNVVMDYLPTPVLGTFWAHSADTKAHLTSVVASQHRVRVDRTALNLRELIEGNVGARVVISEVPAGPNAQPRSYPATIVRVPERSGEELEKTGLPNSGEKLPEKGTLVFLETEAGTRVVSLDRILDVTFQNAPNLQATSEEFRNLLTLHLEWQGGKPGSEAAVGMSYLQKGLRWIPNYKVDLDGKGRATVKLEATLINEIADLQDVTVNLVVGVPTFAFQDMVDPVSLQQTVARLSPYFDQNALSATRISNAIMAQVAAPASAEGREAADLKAPPDLGPEIAGAQKNEDLFVYTVRHVSLRKGQRMVLPVHEVTLPYKDVFTVEIPFAIPTEIRREDMRLNDAQQRDLARLLRDPKAVHAVRLSNKSSYPLTTAPALVMRDGRILAQGLMTYTAIGADGDLPITQAVEIGVKKQDKELKRVPNAETWQGREYGRVDLAGNITITNRRDQPIELEVVRYTLGNLAEAPGGRIEMVNVVEDASLAGWLPPWWPWYAWPDWWFHFNGVGKVSWKVTLEAGKAVDLAYAWNYYWR